MDYKITPRTQRLVQFCKLHPGAMIDLIALGEPVSVNLLTELKSINPELIDKIFNLDFRVMSDFNPYAMGPMERDDAMAIYAFMQNHYGKVQAEDMVLNRDVLWENFLKLATKPLYENGKLVAFFQNLIMSKSYIKAYKLLANVSKKYAFKIQKSITDEQLLDLFERTAGCLSISAENVFDVGYLADKNLITVSVVSAYLRTFTDCKKAVKKILRKKDGLAILKQLNNTQVKAILKDLAVE